MIHEVFLDVFRPYHTLRDLGLSPVQVGGPGHADGRGCGGGFESVRWRFPDRAAIMTLQRSVRVVQCGLMLFLLVFSRYLGTNWRQKSFGIALGFGAFASVELSLVA